MSVRRLPLEGTLNFRDLGGYETEDGRVVRWQHLYRSGSLTALTDDDLTQVADLDLRLVCDFRRDEERDEAPSRLPEAPDVLHLPMGPERAHAPLYAHLSSPDGTPEDVFNAMVDIYKGFIVDHTPEYQVFMEQITHGEKFPLLFHCAAGKDRTGWGAAIIFMALGVPMEKIFEDYILTNEYVVRNLRERYPDLESPELFHTMLDAHPEYLQASLNEVDRLFGGIEGYLADGLKLTEEDRGRLQDQLLEK